jgi:L-iditol 2-dehydrogenase
LADGRYRNPPGVPIHEIVGEVVATNAADLGCGTRVVGWADSANGLAEYVVTNASSVMRYDERLKPAEAVMLQPLACVMYAVDQLGPLAGARAAVIGQGPIGLLFSHVLKTAGASHLTGVDRVDRRATASPFLIDDCIVAASNMWAAEVAGSDERYEVVIEAVGHQTATLLDAVEVMASHGRLYYFGIPDDETYPFPLTKFLRRNGSFSAGATPLDARQVALGQADRYVAAHPELVSPYVTHTLDVHDATSAFRLALEPQPGQCKIVLTTEG